jgi:thiol-disulfide isomerase/thioredoxin
MTAALRRLSCAAACVALAVAPLPGQVPADPLLSGFQLVGDYVLEVDAKDQPSAQIYKSPRSATYLLISSALPSPVLMDPAVGSVSTVNMMKVAKQKDGSVSLLADAALASQGRFEIEGSEIVFSADGHRVKLKPKPPLLKQQTAGALLAYNPVYARNAGAYRPDGAALKTLRSFGKPVRVQVFFGSWCPHCSTYVPHVIKVEEQLQGSKIQFVYYGLPQGAAMARDPEAKRLDVDQVPTGVVFVGGKEVGRIKGDGWRTPEATLTNILEVGATFGG